MGERLTARARDFIAPAVRPGAVALDATAGTGADTAFLATAVGPRGRVLACDIQPAAIERARARLAAQGLTDRVQWLITCHARLSDHTDGIRFTAAMFNLGWLPGGDHGIVTRPATTTAALAAAAARLGPGGRLSIVVYRGHAGGPAEAAAVSAWLAAGAGGLSIEARIGGGGRNATPILYGLERPPA